VATLSKRTTLVGIVILIIGLVITCWVAVWSVAPLQQIDRMSEEVDRAVRSATEQFEPNTHATLLGRDTGYLSSVELRDRKDHYQSRRSFARRESVGGEREDRQQSDVARQRNPPKTENK
jgi:hypothetical protein